MSGIDPYKVLNLPKNHTLDDLKRVHKALSRKLHPDKGGSEELFKMVQEAAKMLYQEHKNRQTGRQHFDLRQDSQSYMQNQNDMQFQNRNFQEGMMNTRVNKGEFNRYFNQVFEETRVAQPFDDGYAGMMAQSTEDRPDINIQRTVKSMKNFNSAFENQPLSDNNKKLMKYRSKPEELPACSGSIGYSIIGQDRVKDFSADIGGLNLTDYRKAYETTRLIDPSAIKSGRKDYRSVDELKNDRSKVSYEMTPDDLRREMRRKEKEERKERERQERAQRQDQAQFKLYEQASALMMRFRD